MKRAEKIQKRTKRLIIAVAGLLVLVIIGIPALYSGLTVKNYVITSDKVNNDGTVRIVEIADLHSQVFGDAQKPLIDIIKAQRPDMIVLVGDIYDIRRPVSGVKKFLEGIKDKAPIYYVSGNHEYWSRKYDQVKEMIEGYGITVLSNERKYIAVNGIELCICGVDDPEVFYYTKDTNVLKYKNEAGILKQFTDLSSDTFNILLAHRPELIDSYRKYDFDLVLSGHTHGGLIRIPLISNGFFAPSQGIFAKYTGGRYDFGNMSMIISRGLASNSVIPRVFDPPEVVVVDIMGNN